MDRIVVTEAFRSILDGVSAPVELIDESGVPIGQFVPPYAKLDGDGCPYSALELERAKSEPGGRSLGEIWATLNVK